jgi:hypothetical protein
MTLPRINQLVPADRRLGLGLLYVLQQIEAQARKQSAASERTAAHPEQAQEDGRS